MSSLDMVAYINATRKPGSSELQHKHFLAKVPTVLGFGTSAEFLAHVQVPGPNGATRPSPVYNFPRREAIRMAMSYSYDLQATVLDAWDAAEAKLAAQAPPVLFGAPTNYLDALKQLVASVEVNQQQIAPAAKVAVFTPPEALSGVKTMSSVEIVEVINAMREPGRAELSHYDFVKKLVAHPGINDGNFSGVYLGGNGEQRPCYYLPKREAELNFP